MGVADYLQILGGCFGLVGSLMVANTYMNVPMTQKVIALLSALLRGRYAKNVASGKGLTVEGTERALIALQGLAFIAVGFLFQTLGVVVAALTKGT